MRARFFILLSLVCLAKAEQGVLVVHIKDLHDHPIENVRLRAGDTSVSAPATKQSGQRATVADRTVTDSLGKRESG